MSGFNGIRVTRVAPFHEHAPRSQGVIFVPLPRSAWAPAGRCACPYCVGAEAYWDTLAIAAAPRKGEPDTTWTVHKPELQPPCCFCDACADPIYTEGEMLCGECRAENKRVRPAAGGVR